MKKLIIPLALIIILIWYILFPKYCFVADQALLMRCNKITGEVDYFYAFEEIEKQHPIKEQRQ